jgi:hypothetical protein
MHTKFWWGDLFVDLGIDGRIAEINLTQAGSMAWTEFI